MKRLFAIILSGMMVCGVVDANAEEMTVDFSADGLFGYVWRGALLGADDKLVLQPAISLGFGESDITAGAWGSVFFQSRNQLESFDEIDLWADYTTALGAESSVSVSIGFTEYLFPNGGTGSKHSEEAYLGLSLDHQFAPSVTFYYDFGLIDDYYVTVGLGPSLPLGEDDNAPTLDLGASVSFSGDSAGYGGKAGFNDATFTASMSFSAGQLSITPIAGITIPKNNLNPDTTFWGGISLGFSR